MHMRTAQAQGWHGKSMLCDYAQAAMEAQDYDLIVAEQAIAKVWRDEFETQPPV
jgi:hypothetical protein